ncbi:MAG: hypothetical protein N2Z71_06960 [Caloramator sp.]|nr:hypothetical protein [Caloramator sp.]
MKRGYKILFLLILMFQFVLTGCKVPYLNSKISKDYKNIDNINKTIENFNLQDIKYKFNLKGVDIDYKNLNGIINMLNLYSLNIEKNLEIKYKSTVSSGNVKVIMVDEDNKIIELLNGAKEGSTKSTIKKNTIIKCIGDNFSGNIKIDILYDEQPIENNDEELKEQQKIAKYLEDGEYFINKINVKDNYASGNIYRIKVINRKIDMLAKIKVQGEIKNEQVESKYQDDGWGNSGYVILDFSNGALKSIEIKITNKKNSASKWGFEEGVYVPRPDIDTKIPQEVLNALN